MTDGLPGLRVSPEGQTKSPMGRRLHQFMRVLYLRLHLHSVSSL